MSQYKNIRIFRNDILEKLTHVHPSLPILFWTPIIFALIYLSGDRSVFAAFGGLLTWTLTEYLLHRYVFHFESKKAFAQRLVYIFHGLHHDEPNDPTRLVMPPFPAALIATILYFLFRSPFATFGLQTHLLFFFAFFLIGYLTYDYCHYFIHHGQLRALGSYGNRLKKHHMAHHFVDPRSNWGVSSPLWDHVFRTIHLSVVRPDVTRPSVHQQ